MTGLPAPLALLPAEGRARGSLAAFDPPYSAPVSQFEDHKRRKTMQSLLRSVRLGVATLAVGITLAGAPANSVALAQTMPPATTAVLSEATVKVLQEALNKQGIAVKADGILSDETRAAIRKYQSQHHLPVTGEPDKATLDKLGVRQTAMPAQPSTLAQVGPITPPASPPPGQTQNPNPPAGQIPPPMQPGQMAQGGMMMNCPMMQGAMPGMMQMMQGMMQMMQMQSGQMMQMQPGQMQTMQGMMQMMQGMMQMMQMMQGEMQPRQMQPGSQ